MIVKVTSSLLRRHILGGGVHHVHADPKISAA
jgi:hypothetical protein